MMQASSSEETPPPATWPYYRGRKYFPHENFPTNIGTSGEVAEFMISRIPKVIGVRDVRSWKELDESRPYALIHRTQLNETAFKFLLENYLGSFSDLYWQSRFQVSAKNRSGHIELSTYLSNFLFLETKMNNTYVIMIPIC